MTTTDARRAVAVLFTGSQTRYDYWCLLDVAVGDNVVVDTKRGEATVVVAEVKQGSDKASAYVKRVVR